MGVPETNSIEGMLLACCAAQLRADVLVAGHHGSRTSSRRTFLDAVQASTFIISLVYPPPKAVAWTKAMPLS